MRLYPSANECGPQSSVWYMCVYNNTQPCYEPEMTSARTRLNYECGWVKSGSVFIYDSNKSFGRQVLGAGVCTNLN
jgi:hypothetical protein